MTLHPYWILLLVALAAGVVVALGHRRGLTTRTVMWRRVAMAGLLLLVALRPTVGSSPSQAAATDVDVLFLVDRSNSIAAEDYDGQRPRLDGVKADGTELVEAFAGAQFSLITFDSTAQVELPFTTDGAAMTTSLETLVHQNSNYGAGSSIDLGLPLAVDLLARRAEEYPDRSQYLVYLGDGEQTVEAAPQSFEELAGLVDGGVVLGYGTAQGGRMRTAPGEDHYVYNYTTNKEAISRIDEAALTAIAEQVDIDYEHRTAPGGLSERADDVGSGGLFGSSSDVVTGREFYWIPAVGLAGLALVELWHLALVALRTRRELS